MKRYDKLDLMYPNALCLRPSDNNNNNAVIASTTWVLRELQNVSFLVVMRTDLVQKRLVDTVDPVMTSLTCVRVNVHRRPRG